MKGLRVELVPLIDYGQLQFTNSKWLNYEMLKLFCGDVFTPRDFEWMPKKAEYWMSLGLYGDLLVGLHIFQLRKRSIACRGWWSVMTAVHPRYRRQGVAKALWLNGFMAHFNGRMRVVTATPAGERFVKSMVKEGVMTC